MEERHGGDRIELDASEVQEGKHVEIRRKADPEGDDSGTDRADRVDTNGCRAKTDAAPAADTSATGALAIQHLN